MWMKRRIQKVKKFELLISTSTYELQLHNGYIFIFYFKIWQLVYCTTFKDMIYQRCYIWISFYRRYNNVTRPSASLRALDFILFEISIVCIYLTHHIGYMTIILQITFYIFLNIVSTVFKLDNFSDLDNLLYYWERENEYARGISRLCWNVLEPGSAFGIFLWVFRVRYWWYFLLRLSMSAGTLWELFFCNCVYVLLYVLSYICNLNDCSMWEVVSLILLHGCELVVLSV